jgi:hypothetical protein
MPIPKAAGANMGPVPTQWRKWNQVALAVARKTGQMQFRIQFFGVPTDRAPIILGEVDLLALDALTAIRQAARWIPTRGATPSTALVPQEKAGFPIPNPRLLLGFLETKTARRTLPSRT